MANKVVTETMNDTLNQLVQEVNMLKKELESLKHKKTLTTQEDLTKFWDNEYDDRWNNA